MNLQRLEELALINACRDDSQDLEFYETNLGHSRERQSSDENDSVVIAIV